VSMIITVSFRPDQTRMHRRRYSRSPPKQRSEEKSAMKNALITAVEFSRRRGLRYAHLQAYLVWLRMQSKAGALFLKRGDLNWSVVDPINEVYAFDHSERAGLQLSDTVASSFYQAVSGMPAPDIRYASALEPRMARGKAGQVFGYGLKLMPDRYLDTASAEQRAIFDFYISKR
jgi:hypothetical protein